MSWFLEGGYKLLLVALLVGTLWFITSLRGDIAEREAGIQRLTEVAESNQATIKALQADKALTEKLLNASATRLTVIEKNTSGIKEKMRNVQVSADCQAADDRDRAVLVGVRELLNPGRAD